MAGKSKRAEEAEAEAEAEAAAAAADTAGEGEEAAKPARKLPLKLILMAVGGLAVVGGGGTGGYMMFASKGKEKPAEIAAKPASFIDVPEVLVNLSSTGDRTQYLKVKVVLEIPDEKLKEKITPVMPRVMDAFQTFLRELRPSDLEGSAGLYRLKEELTRRVNVAIAPNKINAVLFKEVVVQ